MKRRKTDMGNDYIQAKDSDRDNYSVISSVAQKEKIYLGCDSPGTKRIFLSRKKALELSKVLAYFGNTGKLPRIYRGGISMTEPERNNFNPVRKENDPKIIKRTKPFVYCQNCSYCKKYTNMLKSFDCKICGEKIQECPPCHRALPPQIRNKKICKKCFNSEEINLSEGENNGGKL